MDNSAIKNKRIIIIGGAGFIGHNLALHLKALGAQVSVVDSLEVNNITSVLANSDNLPHPALAYSVLQERLNLLKTANIPLHVQDARDYHGLSKIITETDPQVIFHLAAVSHANRSNKDPFSTFDHSLRTLENALDNAKNRVEHFIFLSSSMVYGNFKDGSVDETTPCEPIGIYGALKFAGEKMVIAYNQVFDLPYTIIRPSALYGERCISRRVGQIFIENALLGETSVIQGDGGESLDFTYIQDLVDGLTQVVASKNSLGQIFNMTYGSSRSIKDMTEILREEFPNVSFDYKAKDKLTPTRGTLNVDKARELIGYAPKWPLEEGYKLYIDWYKKLFEKSPTLSEEASTPIAAKA